MAGAAGAGGKGDNGVANNIATGRVRVPAALWKVIVVLAVRFNDLKRTDARKRVIDV